MRRHRLPIAAIALCMLSAQTAVAQTFDWINTTSGTFSNAANWSPAGGPPDAAAETARFNGAGTYNVTFAGNATFGILTQNQGDATFFLNGWTLQPTNTVSNGMGATGLTSSLRMSNGFFLPGNFSVGGNLNSTSNLILENGLNATIGSGVFYIGTSGTGHLTLQSGATITTTTGSVGIGINAVGVGTATIHGPGSIWTVNNTLRVGLNGNGTMNVTGGGGVIANALEVGEGFNSVGSLTVSGGNSVFTSSGAANIGGAVPSFAAAAATLNVGNGGTVNLNGSTNVRSSATVNITGGTLNLNTLIVSPGAQVNWSTGTVNFANATSITPAILNLFLAGGNTLAQNQTLSATAGTINLTSNLALTGGKIMAPDVQLNAHVNIGAFSSIAVTNSITIESGKTVQIEDFGSMSAGPVIINNGGTLLLDGPAATVTTFMANNFGLIQGTGRFAGGLNNGTGGTIRANAGDHIVIQLSGLTNPGNIELAGGTIEYTNTLSNLGNGFISGRGVFKGGTSSPGSNGLSNIGVVALSAGTTDIYGDVINSGAGRIVAAGGAVVTFYDDVLHNGTEIRTNNGARTVIFGGLTGAGPFTGTGTVESNGDLKPGNSAAEVTFGGDLELGDTGGLEIEIGGTIKGGRYDALTIAGSAMIGGDLDVELIDSFIPQFGQTFEILTAGDGRSGTFDDLTFPLLGGGLDFDVVYSSNAITLAVAGLPGDYNRDGTVDAADYVVWRKTGGIVGTALAADGNSNGSVDPGDYEVWAAHFGQSLSGAGSIMHNAVPEPTSMALVVFAFALVSYRRRL